MLYHIFKRLVFIAMGHLAKVGTASLSSFTSAGAAVQDTTYKMLQIFDFLLQINGQSFGIGFFFWFKWVPD
jgi:hypothetical protein